MAYFEVDPFGEERADLRAGIVASAVANANRVKGKSFKPKDFMPQFDQKRPQGAGEQISIVKQLHRQLGGQ